MAGLFLFTAVATCVVVIISVVSSNNSAKPKTNCTGAVVTATTNGKLAGTCLSGFVPVDNNSVTNLKLTDLKIGTGTEATSTSTVGVLYTGAVADTGVIFQSSLDNGPQPVSFSLNGGVIVGFQDGITGMKVGGERQILIPAAEAYGANPPANSGIPANAALVFNVTLLSVK
jgi:hypothetical protein